MRLAPLGVALPAATLAACIDTTAVQYGWDDRATLCSLSVDDLLGRNSPWDEVLQQLDTAKVADSVALFHAHDPGRTIAITSIDRILREASTRGLDFVTYAELEPHQRHRGALALAFDDQYVDQWFELRALFAQHGARVTFFLTRVHLYDAATLDKVALLAADGHGIEAHAVDHLEAPAFVREHSLADYLDVEVVPSIQILEDRGYPITTFAYPFGAASSTIDAAVLHHVRHTRIGTGDCPYDAP